MKDNFAYLGTLDPNGTGAVTGAAFSNGLFKSGGFNCLAHNLLQQQEYMSSCSRCSIKLKGNKLPNTAELEYSLSLTRFSHLTMEKHARLSYRHRDESNSSAFESKNGNSC